MAKITKHIQFQIHNNATSATNYSRGATCPFTWDTADWDGSVTVYFEATISTSNASATAYAQLSTTGGSAVTGSELSTSSTAYTRLRSGAITLTSGQTYTTYLKISNASYSCRVRDARLIIVQDNASEKTTTAVSLTGRISTTSTDYGRSSSASSTWKYTASLFGGSTTVYFEGGLATSNASGTAYARLYEVGVGPVTGSEISCSTTTIGATKYRSSAITLVDGASYYVEIKTDNASYTTTLYTSRILILQTTSAFPTVDYSPLSYLGIPVTTTSTSGVQQSESFLYHDDAEWGGANLSIKLAGTLKISNASGTSYIEAKTGGSVATSISTSSTAETWVEGTPFTPTDNTEYEYWYRSNNSSYTATTYGAWFMYISTLQVAGISLLSSMKSKLI